MLCKPQSIYLLQLPPLTTVFFPLTCFPRYVFQRCVIRLRKCCSVIWHSPLFTLFLFEAIPWTLHRLIFIWNKNFRTRHQRCSLKEPALKNFVIFVITVGLKACLFIEKRLQHRCFPVIIAKFKDRLLWRTSVNGCF